MNLIEQTIAHAANLDVVKPGDQCFIPSSCFLPNGEHKIKVVREDMGQSEDNRLLVAGSDLEVFKWGGVGAVPLFFPPTSWSRCLEEGGAMIIVPETLYIDVSGNRDHLVVEHLLIYLNHYFQTDGLMGMGVIVGGNTTETMNVVDRMEIARFLADLGCVSAVISPLGPKGQVEKVIKIKVENM